MRQLRAIILIIIHLFILVAVEAEGFKRTGLKIESLEPVKINGIDQWLLIRGNDETNPILLYLHGGPGHSLIPFAHVATDKLVDKFIVVYWDQRGTGLSYNDKIPPETMNISQFIDDTKTVTEYLKKKFGKEKIYLLGHSWGSMLGTLTVDKYPEDYVAYIGVGQVVNNKLMMEERDNWLKKTINELGTANDKKALQSNVYNQVELIAKYGGSVHKSDVNTAMIMQSSPYYPEIFTNLLYDKGYAFTQPLRDSVFPWYNLVRQVTEIKIRLFLCGRYDYLTPPNRWLIISKFSKRHTKKLSGSKESAHHRMDIEEPEKFQNTIMEIAEKQGK